MSEPEKDDRQVAVYFVREELDVLLSVLETSADNYVAQIAEHHRRRETALENRARSLGAERRALFAKLSHYLMKAKPRAVGT